jgi:hypothetical protein
MLARLRRLLFFLIAGAMAVPAAAAVTVSFTHPERYTDAPKYYAQWETIQRDLERHFEQLGKRYLAPGRTLAVEVLDIDLAGRYEPARRDGYEIRILHDGADFPRMKVRYVLRAEGRVLASGEETVEDRDYRFHSSPLSSSAPLSYEKRMLSDWFRARFVERRPVQGP